MKGSYTILVEVSQNFEIEVGSLGKINFPQVSTLTMALLLVLVV